MLAKIKDDVQDINYQIQSSKNQLKVKKEEGIRGSSGFGAIQAIQRRDTRGSMLSTLRNNKAVVDFLEAPDQLSQIRSKDLDEGDFMVDILKQLQSQNSELQGRISELQNKLGQKNLDLSIK